ncbi:hypothetical protein AO1008_04875 [Aspergillus oryzae 100-8]|uniref:Uncharacterized protein n=1 Tax=Aspergillus oryzae (strain 3.042) TaxID=1160506 RepID=I7ZP52_ASPO3|nr:hypothetical protein Ao3042_10450 [Aspergillus oryzae 3.042]KDE78553.1 hypothetical protein AO1008_04875 [Aspergillus oryzae 100-8]|eukprot:EIT73759.1 hypothetical protein Ao3042_10450 [Aspergillus oryzae 3.042]
MRSTVQERDQIQVVINACQELTALLTEPYEWIANAAWGYVDSVALSLVLSLKVHRHVPKNGGTISLVDLAAKTGSSVVLITRQDNATITPTMLPSQRAVTVPSAR